MKALGNDLQPGYFPPDEEDRIPYYYRCSFGIAQHVPGWVAGEQNVVLGRGQSQLVVSGPEDRVYWFFFDKLPEVKYGKDIPKYTKQDEAEFVKQNGSCAFISSHSDPALDIAIFPSPIRKGFVTPR
jgi:hypothetical protein